MGEGWSDAIAIFLTRSGNETRETGDATIASYAKPTAPNGLRKRPYSTNMTTSPWTYKELFGWKEPHSSGELWGLYLNELYWNLVDKLGFSTNWYDSKQPQGNIVTLQLILGGMMLQPCNPTFKMGRDAIIEADQVYYNGTYKCDIWKAFAKRGLGANSYTNADNNTYTDGFQLPGACSDVN